MKMKKSWTIVVFSLAIAISGLVPDGAWAVTKGAKGRRAKEAEMAAAFDTISPVELFEAIQGQQLDVTLIPKDATHATVVFKNRTDQPLKIELPEAFAGVPVLAQQDGGDFGGGGRRGGRGGDTGGGSGGNNANQSFGGGLGGGGGGLGGGGGGGGFGGGGFFNLPPDTVRKVAIDTVCLEHGKRDPHPRVEYAIQPIESLGKDPAVTQIVGMLARGEINQSVAQAATWNLTDGLSWNELANKVKVNSRYGLRVMYFSPQQVQEAMRVSQWAKSQAKPEEPAQPQSPGELAER